jgi:inosine-uridine nucleoside N-ribohydrolase
VHTADSNLYQRLVAGLDLPCAVQLCFYLPCELTKLQPTELSKFMKAITTKWILHELQVGRNEFTICDAVAIAAALWPEKVITHSSRHWVQVVLGAGYARGATCVDWWGHHSPSAAVVAERRPAPNVRVVEAVNVPFYLAEINNMVLRS